MTVLAYEIMTPSIKAVPQSWTMDRLARFLIYLLNGSEMKRSVLSVDEQTPVGDIAHIRMREHLHRIFVTRESKITGIITTYDMLKLISDKELTQRCARND